MKALKSILTTTTLAILTTFTLIVWIAVESYLRLNAKDLSSIPQNVLEPLNPNLDTKILDQISKKLYFNEEELRTIIQTPLSPENPPSSGPGPEQP